MSESSQSTADERSARSKRTDAIAVALGYEPGQGKAPTVLASGRGTVAEQILAIAFAQGVRVREDADLAELLAAVEVDSEIPVEALAAVAEILSYVYRANGRLGHGQTDADDTRSVGRPGGQSGDRPRGDAAAREALTGWSALFADPPARTDQSSAPRSPSSTGSDWRGPE
ncbi:hypothetical protein F1188_15850 [Roseospira marina]|uniref:Flagellar protein FhlB n=1 Tax=Roseospira marina TaxID=140057 RepID=A0A5M6I8D5_9PROT|nr:hypothetical protein F1188_15850 [Roseospira marina]MBB4315563.1 type III secretion system FlhB-like substrate exporter [Roseospira marina]MBB5088500.1 type III secretion system FlhB-like substrate exporter [Roseospira marina]